MLALQPVAYWSFQGLAPGALHDLTGNGHDLSTHGAPTFANVVPGLDGFEYAGLGGVADYFTAAVSAALNPHLFTLISLAFIQNAGAYLYSNSTLAGADGWDFGSGDLTHSAALFLRVSNNLVLDDSTALTTRQNGFALLSGGYDGFSAFEGINGTNVSSLVSVAHVQGVGQTNIGKSNLSASFMKGGVSDTALFDKSLLTASVVGLAAAAGLPTAFVPGSFNAILAEIYAAVHKIY
jgi:hypothetical protein